MSRVGITVCTASISLACATIYRREVRMQFRMMISKYLDQTRIEPDISHGEVVENFRSLDVDIPEGKSVNPHKTSAAIRTAAVTFIRMFNLRLGTDESSISMSARDQRDGVKGTRPYFWAKDCDKTPTNDISGARSYVDVDYHCNDLEYDLAGRTNHSILFTIVPTSAASSAESSHTFRANGNIAVSMSGGGSYEHPLWDWTPDTITCSKRVLGIPYSTTIYKVEKRSLDSLKALVILAPLGTWTGLSSILASTMDSGALKRFNCVKQGFAHLRCNTKEGIYHSIARVGAFVSAKLTAQEFDSMSIAASLGKQGPTTGSMATWCDQRRGDALIMADYLSTVVGHKAPFVTLVKDAVKSVSANVATHGDVEERISVQAFMQPIIADNCYAHTDHDDNAKWAVEARITSVAAKKTQALTPFTATCIGEFVKMAFPDRLSQADLQMVYDKQTRPLQRRTIAEAVESGPSERTSLRSFLKKEAYAGEKDPRIITTYQPQAKIGYSVYTYALTLQMKTHEWYGFKTPEQIAARVAQICTTSEYVIEGDFSRMDGRVDKNVRETFEASILRRAFPDDSEVLRLHKLQYNQKASVGEGVTYDQGYARGSGSPETSCFNTALTAFVAYLSERMLGEPPASAFSKIGLVAGDDSLKPGNPNSSPALATKRYEAAAKLMGQVLTSDLKIIGEHVTFLARIWGEAWHGDMNSMASPLRLLSKVHTAVNLGTVTAEVKCREKGESILTGDANTPIIGELAKKMTSIGARSSAIDRLMIAGYWSKFEDCSWPNEYCNWMEDAIYKELGGFDYEAFNDWLENGHPLTAPTCFIHVAKTHTRPLMVDGTHNHPPTSVRGTIGSFSTSSKSTKSSRTRRGSKRGTSVQNP